MVRKAPPMKKMGEIENKKDEKINFGISQVKSFQ